MAKDDDPVKALAKARRRVGKALRAVERHGKYLGEREAAGIARRLTEAEALLAQAPPGPVEITLPAPAGEED